MRSSPFTIPAFIVFVHLLLACGSSTSDPNAGGLTGFSTGTPKAGAVPTDGTSLDAPQVTGVVIGNNPAKNGDMLHVSVSFSDTQGDIAFVNVGIQGQGTHSSISVASIGTQTSGSLTLDLKPVSTAGGSYTLMVSITDLAGHTGIAVAQPFTILNPDGTVPGSSGKDASVSTPDAGTIGPVDTRSVTTVPDTKTATPDTASATGYWELVQKDVFDKLAAADTNYALTVLDGSVACSWSLNNDIFNFTASWTVPPTQIRATDKIPLTIGIKIDQNVGSDYSSNGNFDLFFDRPECEPGSIIAPIGLKSSTGELASLAVSHRPGAPVPAPMQVFINGKDLPTGTAGARIALMAVAYNGRSSGIRYIYAWKN